MYIIAPFLAANSPQPQVSDGTQVIRSLLGIIDIPCMSVTTWFHFRAPQQWHLSYFAFIEHYEVAWVFMFSGCLFSSNVSARSNC